MYLFATDPSPAVQGLPGLVSYHVPIVRTRLYRDGELEREDVALGELDDLVHQEGITLWLVYTSPTAEDLAGIEKVLGLHRLAVEDAVHEHQRPKLDRYPPPVPGLLSRRT